MARKDKYLLQKQDFSGNFRYLIIIITLSVAVIVAKLAYMQLLKSGYYLDLSRQNYIRLIGLVPVRGEIISSDNMTCATNRPTFSIYVSVRGRIKERVIRKLSEDLNLPVKYIKSKLSMMRYYQSVILKPNASRKDVFMVLADSDVSRFVNVEVSPRRYYPSNAYEFANIVGYVSEVSKKDLRLHPEYKVGEFVGRKGVEKKYNGVLRGRWGYKEIEVSADGSVVRTLSETPPRRGKNLQLSMDMRLQSYIYNLLNTGEYRGSIVIMKPDGHILAMANTGSFDPNLFVEGIPPDKWRMIKKKKLINLFDTATQGAYPPGSLIKPFIALSALKDGVITLDTTLMCPYSIKIGKNVYRDWKYGGFGKIKLKRAIESSSDVFFYQVGLKLGINKLDYYLSKFGFGRSPGLFSYCTKGTLPSRIWKYKKYHQEWYIGDTVTTSIGQGFFLASPLQVAVAFSVIANNGIGYRPTLIKDAKPEVRYVFKSRFYRQIKYYLWLVVNGKYGTARIARINGMDICGKTGTSQVVSSSVYRKMKKLLLEKRISFKKAEKYFPHAWFASFAPMKHPKVIVVVFLEHGEYSSRAAFLAKSIYLYLRELGFI